MGRGRDGERERYFKPGKETISHHGLEDHIIHSCLD